MPKKDGLTPKQAAFVQEYLIDLNATQAAKRAGYKGKNLDNIGAQLLGKTHVSNAIRNAQAQRAEKTGRTAFDVLKDIADTAKEARGQGDLKTALKGYELEGKHYGLFDKKDTSADKAEEMLKRMETLADHIYNPKPSRKLEDFE